MINVSYTAIWRKEFAKWWNFLGMEISQWMRKVKPIVRSGPRQGWKKLFGHRQLFFVGPLLLKYKWGIQPQWKKLAYFCWLLHQTSYDIWHHMTRKRKCSDRRKKEGKQKWKFSFLQSLYLCQMWTFAHCSEWKVLNFWESSTEGTFLVLRIACPGLSRLQSLPRIENRNAIKRLILYIDLKQRLHWHLVVLRNKNALNIWIKIWKQKFG